jgi:hypothetical protein
MKMYRRGMRVFVNKLHVKLRRKYTIDSRIVVQVMSSSNVDAVHVEQHEQRHWMIPSNTPDLTPIERIQSASRQPLSSDMMDAIVCQVRLNVSVIQNHEHDTSNEKEHTTANIYNNDTYSRPTIHWTLDALNRYGCPTPRYHWLNNKNTATDDDDGVVDNDASYLNHSNQQPELQHEFYIVFHTHEHSIPGNRPLAIGIITVSTNLIYQYTIRWIASPVNSLPTSTSKASRMTKRGHVSIHFLYSLGMGCIAPPYKQSLFHGGAIQTNYICHNIIGSLEENSNNNNFELMSIEPFIPPTISKKLSSYDMVLAFGDSILEQLIASKRCPTNINDTEETTNDGSINHNNTIGCCCQDRIHFGPKVASPLNSRTISTLLNELDTFLQPYIQKSKSTNNNSIALVLNSALWDVLSDEATVECETTENDELVNSRMKDPWQEHLTTLNEYLNHIHEKYSTKNRMIKLYWILPTAVHIHRVHLLSDPILLQKAPQKIIRTKYMSSSRTYDLYQKQKCVINKINQKQHLINNTNESTISMLDIYEATYLSADWTLPGDGRHYRPELNQLMLSWFYLLKMI